MFQARPILTASQMLAAEQAAIATGATVERLMERAGAALAEAAYRFSGGMPALILCGPGNNGGDGYVAARHLAERGVAVRVAAVAEPVSDACRRAGSGWSSTVEELSATTEPAPLVVDAMFGTGLKRGLEKPVEQALLRLCSASHLSVACDLPSGVASDSGELLSEVPLFGLTVTFGALKPAHRLSPAIHRCGRVAVADIGVPVESAWNEIGAPALPSLRPDGHKYDRGLVHAFAGEMPGAIALAVVSAARAGAGYVRVSTSRPIEGIPAAVVQTGSAEVNDRRIGCLLVGPGMGNIPQLLTLALTSNAPKVIDADAINQLGAPERLRGQDAILTPHSGEFVRLFRALPGSKADQALAAAIRSGAVIVYKGPDTLVASPDGRLGFAPPAPSWLASAGTGDVLAGIIAAMRARGLSAFDAACAGVWLQGRAAELAGPGLIADDLAAAVPDALALL